MTASAPAKPAATPRPTHLPPDVLRVRPHHQLRAIKPDVLASIKLLGVLIPINIEQDADDGEYYIRAGHNRHRCALLAGCELVPVSFEDPKLTRPDGKKLSPEAARALIRGAENMSRVNLDFVGEALEIRALQNLKMPRREIQRALTCSPQKMKSRERLFDIDEDWWPVIAAGLLNDDEIDELVGLCTAHKPLAKALLEFNRQHIKRGLCTVDATSIVAAGRMAEGFWPLGDDVDPDELELDEEAHQRIDYLIRSSGGSLWHPVFNEHEIDRARAAGVLWETGAADGFYAQRVIWDREFYRELVLSNLERTYLQRQETQAQLRAASAGADETLLDAEARGQRRREALEVLNEARERATEMNVRLGESLVKGLSNVRLTPEIVSWLVQDIARTKPKGTYGLRPVGSAYSIIELATGGVRYCLPAYHSYTEPQRGEARLRYAEPEEAGGILTKWLSQAKSPGQRLGRLLIAVIAHEFAIDEVVARSRRGSRADIWAGPGDATKKALKRIAKPHLPPGLEAARRNVRKAEEALSKVS